MPLSKYYIFLKTRLFVGAHSWILVALNCSFGLCTLLILKTVSGALLYCSGTAQGAAQTSQLLLRRLELVFVCFFSFGLHNCVFFSIF